jgi:uncharacterized phage protein gp47/JayE
MILPTRIFSDLVRDMSTAITASASRLIDISVGSVLRAIIEANAAIALWVQWLILLTLQTTRAATSSGVDLDSWMADFLLLRLPAKRATGTATFSRFFGTAAAFIPVGTIVKTQDGSFSFAVSIDNSNPAWLSGHGGYSVSSGVRSIDLPIVASLAGRTGNVLSDTITILASPVSGIDTITNVGGTIGGEDAETDASFRIRFANFFAARSRATLDAIGYAISLIGPNLSYVIQENVDTAGNRRLGNMLIVVDDGSGLLSDALFNALAVEIETVRPIGTTFSIQPAQVMQVQVTLSIEFPSGYVTAPIHSQLQTVINGYINSLQIGGTLSVTRISQLAYLADSHIVNISDVTLNGQRSDLIAPPTTSFVAQGVSFT